MKDNEIKEIITFILNPDADCNGYYLLLSLFEKRFLKFSFPHESCLDAFHDFLKDKIWNNEKLLNFVNNNKNKESISYVVRTIQNFLITYWNKNKNHLETLSLNNKISDTDAEFIENMEFEAVSNEIKFEAFSLLNYLDDKFDEKKKRILCQFLFGKDKDFNLGMGKDAFYKAVERLKKELTDIVINNRFAQESVEFLFNNIFVSEICEKLS